MTLFAALLAIAFGLPTVGQSEVHPAALAPPDSGRTVAYVGGHVWDGEQFTERPLLVRDGLFIGPQVNPDTTINVRGGYVVPPFGDAHTHMLGNGGISIPFAEELFLQNGIFYALDATNPYSEIGAERDFDLFEKPMSIRDWFKKPAVVDVVYAIGGITSTGSHPASAMERLFGYADAPGALAGDAYWFMDSVADVREKWPDYIAQRPDVVKVYLLDVEESIQEGDMRGHGLRPEVLRAVVERAHEAGMRVFAHIVTAADFRLALDAGVDVMAHMLDYECSPGQDEGEYRLDAETIRRASEQDVIVVTTVWTQLEDIPAILEPDQLQCAIEFYRETARRLHEAEVRLALGADDWRRTSLTEATLFRVYDFFDNKTLLNLWTETTPQAIFPKRGIGELAEGYEASFLVLGGNPIEDFEAVRDIRVRVKQGHILADPKRE